MSKLLHIDEVYVFIAENPGGEGVVGGTMDIPGIGPSFIPFIASDRSRVDQLMPIAKMLAGAQRRPIRLVRFTTREEMETITE